MANNPFETPASMSTPYQAPPTGAPPATAPGALTVICVLCIILGALGTFAACMGSVGTVMQSQIQEMQQNVGDPAQRQMQKDFAEIQNKYFIPSLVMVLANFVVGPCLLAGGIGVLSRKLWGVKILKLGLMMAAVFVFIRAIVGLIMQFAMMGPMREAIKKAGGGGNAQGAQAAESFVTGAFYAGFIFAVIWALLLVGFYLWSWTYMNRDKVRSYCGTFG